MKIAFCGCGNAARAHARVLQQLPNVHCWAYWNRPEEGHLAEEMLREFGGRYCTEDFARIAADPDITAVYICTMHNDRLRLVKTMARAGKPMFVEKPLAHTPETLCALYRLMRETKSLFQAGYKIRYHTLVQRARELLPQPDILSAHVFDTTWPAGILNAPDGGGGNVRAQGVYGAEALHVLAGSLPVAVTAFGGNRRQRSGIEDTLGAVYEFANGAIGTLAVADAGAGVSPVSKFFVEAVGRGCSYALLERFTRLEYLHGPTGQSQTLTGEEDGFIRQTRSFLAAIRRETPVLCDILQGAIPSIMIYQALHSAVTGRREPIDIEAWLSGEPGQSKRETR